MKTLFLITFLISTDAQAFNLEKYLRKNSKINSFVDTYDKNKAKENKLPLQPIKDEIAKSKKTKFDGAFYESIDLVDYKKIFTDKCEDCSTYVQLSDDVSKILKNMTVLDDKNKQFIDYQANSIQFLSLQVRDIDQKGKYSCNNYGMESKVFKSHYDEVQLIYTELANTLNLKSLQYLNDENKEIRYLYKINVNGKNQLVEAVIKNNEAKLYYFDYKLKIDQTLDIKLAEEKTPLLEFLNEIKPTANKMDLDISSDHSISNDIIKAKIQFDPNIVLRDNAIPTDLEIGKIQLKSKLTDKSSVEATSRINISSQDIEAVFKKDDTSFLKITASNDADDKQTVITEIPLKVSLNKERGLELNAKFKHQDIFNIDSSEDEKLTNQTVSLVVKDKDNKYIGITLLNDHNKNYQSLIASNEIKINNRNSFTASYSIDTNGANSYSIGHNIEFHNFGKLSTSYGETQESTESKKVEFFKISHSKKISKNTSLGVEAIGENGDVATVLFRLESKN